MFVSDNEEFDAILVEKGLKPQAHLGGTAVAVAVARAVARAVAVHDDPGRERAVGVCSLQVRLEPSEHPRHERRVIREDLSRDSDEMHEAIVPREPPIIGRRGRGACGDGARIARLRAEEFGHVREVEARLVVPVRDHVGYVPRGAWGAVVSTCMPACVQDHVGYVRGEVLEVVHEEAARLATVGVIIVCGDESRAKARAEGV